MVQGAGRLSAAGRFPGGWGDGGGLGQHSCRLGEGPAFPRDVARLRPASARLLMPPAHPRLATAHFSLRPGSFARCPRPLGPEARSCRPEEKPLPFGCSQLPALPQDAAARKSRAGRWRVVIAAPRPARRSPGHARLSGRRRAACAAVPCAQGQGRRPARARVPAARHVARDGAPAPALASTRLPGADPACLAHTRASGADVSPAAAFLVQN